ncbi:DUF3810 domain-containing protein [Flaviaesturariibacter terrae]
MAPRKSPFRDRLFWFLLLATAFLQWFTASAARVERVYSQGLYPGIGRALRGLFGWVPFSFGDFLYLAAGAWLAWRVGRFVRALFRGGWRRHLDGAAVVRTAKILLGVYLLFEALWGLNYNRQGIAVQVGLRPEAADTARLRELTLLLQDRLCTLGDRVDSAHRGPLSNRAALYGRALRAYDSVQGSLPFLAYRRESIKPSLYSPVAHLFGFSGYYNPFTGEAQVHTGFPPFMQPFVVCHEMGHQLGYARENEANFAGFLAARASRDADFAYSAYFEMYLYALRELARKDPIDAYMLRRAAHYQVRRDFRAYREYINSKKNVVEPFVSRFYDGYLRLNHQEHGLDTYNEVVQWLLAYLRVYGPHAI